METSVVDFARSPAGKGNSGESHYGRVDALSINELIDEFDSPQPVRRINAQDTLVQRGAVDGGVLSQLLQRLSEGTPNENQETWTIWTLGRIPTAVSLAEFLVSTLHADSKVSLNLQIQSVRILAYRAKQFAQTKGLKESLRIGLQHAQPRLRFAAIHAIHETREKSLVSELLTAIGNEPDATVFYAAWQTLRALNSPTELRGMLSDSNAPVRRAALLGLLETQSVTQKDVQSLAENDSDTQVREVAQLWLTKIGNNSPRINGRSLQAASAVSESESEKRISPVRNTKVKNGASYQVIPSGFKENAPVYSDRSYRLKDVPRELEGRR